MIRILIADDHGIVRQGIRSILEKEADFEIVGEAADGRSALEAMETARPEVVVMDVAMPGLNGLDAAAQIARRYPSTGIILLTMYEDEDYVVRAMTSGVLGYLLKDAAEQELAEAVRAVAARRTYFSPAISRMLAEDFTRLMQRRGVQDSYELLTEREREVLQLLAEGKSNKEAAALLELSPYTIETHRNNLMQKLNLHNTAELVLYAVRKKVVS